MLRRLYQCADGDRVGRSWLARWRRTRGRLERAAGPPLFESLEPRVLLAADPIYSINVGGPSVDATAAGGVVWSADTKGAPSPYVNAAGTGNYIAKSSGTIDTTDASIASETPSAIFFTERWDPLFGQEMQWDLPVLPGTYEVRLFFAETYSGAQNVGQRQFDIQIEGATVASSFDQVAETGGWRRGIMRSYSVASDGNLDIDFLHVKENPTLKGIQVVPLAVAPPANLGASVSSLDLGSAAVGMSATADLILTHMGDPGADPITLGAVTIGGAASSEFSAQVLGDLTLAATETRTVRVAFTPSILGAATADLTIAHSGTNSPISVTLTGTGEAGASTGATLAAHAAGLSFGEVGLGETRELELLLTHAGDAQSGPLSVTGLSLTGGAAGDFTATLQGDTTLQPGESRTVKVAYTASALGSVVAGLEVVHSGENSPIQVALSASAVAPPVSGQVIYRVNVGGPQIASTDGGPTWAADRQSSPSPLGNAAAAGSKTFSSSLPVDISHPSLPAGVPEALFKTERYDPSVGEEMAFAFPVDAGSYQLRLYFAETHGPTQQAGKRVFDIQIEGGTVTDNFDQFVAAGGGSRGVAKMYTLDVQDGLLNVRLAREASNPNLKGVEVVRLEAPPTPMASLGSDLSSLSFGGVEVGQSAELDVVLSHAGDPGSDPIDITGVTIEGVDAGDFTASLIGGSTLLQGESRTVRVSFAPSAIGAVTGGVRVTHSGDNSPVLISLTAQGTQPAVNPPSLAADTGTLVFGDVELDETQTLDVVLTHGGEPGTAAITLGSVSVVGAAADAYTATLIGDAVLQQGESRTVRVSVTPTVGGEALATLQVVHDGVSSPLNVSLSAVGVEAPAATPTLAADAGSLNFSDVTLGESVERDVVLTWTGEAGGPPVVISSIGVTGGDAAAFSASLVGTTTVVEGESRTVRVAFAPTAEGAASATLEVVHDGTASPLTVSLAGSGVAETVAGLEVLYRVNAGGNAIAAIDDGPDWAADTAGDPSPYSNFAGTGNKTYSTGAPINIAHPSVPFYAPASLFQTERWDPSGGEDMAWSLPVTPGTYDVALYFAEIFPGSDGVAQRVFDVNIEGNLVADDLDPWLQAGGYERGYVATYSVQSDEQLDILFTRESQNPALKGIEISRGTNVTGEALGVVGGTLTFLPQQIANPVSRTTQVVHLGGPGSDPITLTGATLSGPGAAAFTIVSGDDVVLQPGETGTITVEFNPAAVTTYTATLTVTHDGNNPPVTISLSGDGVVDQPIGFGKSTLVGSWTGSNPTSLQWGPDGRLYVGHQSGIIKVYTVTRNAANDYEVLDTQTIFSVKNILNHDDDGTPNPSVTSRLVTGILVTGTAEAPVIYVASSDPRIGAGPSGADLNLDTNSGVLSRLSWDGTQWNHLDLVRGLPRSEENHASNGLAMLPDSNTLLIAQGGHTNMGAPSHNFALQPEYALSAAILQVDLDAIGETTYDLPTLDDLGQPGTTDNNDPFGGNDGHNQAILVPGGPVTIYSTGWRNAYDLVVAQDGRLYSVDNGPNGGWGGPPVDEGTNVTNTQSEPGSTYGDGLHLVTGPGYYAGHPNPTRANPDNPLNHFNGVNPLTGTASPVSTPNPIEGEYFIPGVEDGALHVFNASTNGIVEYSATNFNGQMAGDLLVASFNEVIFRVQRNADGTAKEVTKLFQSVGSNPLDVTAVGDDGLFPGSIWVATYGDKQIYIFEPNDAGGGGGTVDPNDFDGDGYTNDDEAANGTDPYSAADVPPDWDTDFVSNLTDPDDDNDTLPDTSDPFAVDADNGASTNIGVLYEWENEGEALGGLLDLGFTGIMTDGVSNYEVLYDEAALTAGGAAGVLTIDAAGQGTAVGGTNLGTQGFQFGFNPVGYSGRFAAITRVAGPWQGITPQPGQQMGLQIGDGTQSNFFNLALDGDGSILLIHEVADVPTLLASAPIDLTNLTQVDMWLSINPLTDTLDASYAVDGGERISLITGVAIDPATLTAPMAVGVIATAGDTGVTLPVTWDHLGVIADPTDPGDPGTPGATLATVTIDPPGTNINKSSTFSPDSFRIFNDAASGRRISQVSIDLSTSLFPDVVFDPFGDAGDAASKPFEPRADDATATGLAAHAYTGDNGGGFTTLTLDFADFDPGETLRFAIDIDPTNMKGASAPGPNHSGSVSGLEMVGATVTVAFDDGTTLVDRTWHLPNSVDGSEVAIAQNLPEAPTLHALSTPGDNATVTGTAQTLRIGGTPGQAVSLLQVEGGLYLDGVPNGGFDIDPYEANVALNQQEFHTTIGSEGYVDIPVTLLDTDSPSSGINHFIATTRTQDGRPGGVSNRVILQLI